MKTILATQSGQTDADKPIHNPFGDFYTNNKELQPPMILRSKRGDESVEIEMPKYSQDNTDFVIPMGPLSTGSHAGRGLASLSAPSLDPGMGAPAESAPPSVDDSFKDRKATPADHEIVSTFPQGLPEDDGKRRDIEQSLGLVPTNDPTPDHDKSYLAEIDGVKQLYRGGRYEAALIATEDLIRQYPTNAKLYEMRGTLLDRLGQTDLALKSWKQALRFDPRDQTLKRFVDRKERNRSLASP